MVDCKVLPCAVRDNLERFDRSRELCPLGTKHARCHGFGEGPHRRVLLWFEPRCARVSSCCGAVVPSRHPAARHPSVGGQRNELATLVRGQQTVHRPDRRGGADFSHRKRVADSHCGDHRRRRHCSAHIGCRECAVASLWRGLSSCSCSVLRGGLEVGLRGVQPSKLLLEKADEVLGLGVPRSQHGRPLRVGQRRGVLGLIVQSHREVVVPCCSGRDRDPLGEHCHGRGAVAATQQDRPCVAGGLSKHLRRHPREVQKRQVLPLRVPERVRFVGSRGAFPFCQSGGDGRVLPPSNVGLACPGFPLYAGAPRIGVTDVTLQCYQLQGKHQHGRVQTAAIPHP
eukprot:m.149680 g.149680  ORF g.149680 m.149680 type:complete len:341 (+) comp23262_c0_seq1:701-1723(+)